MLVVIVRCWPACRYGVTRTETDPGTCVIWVGDVAANTSKPQDAQVTYLNGMKLPSATYLMRAAAPAEAFQQQKPFQLCYSHQSQTPCLCLQDASILLEDVPVAQVISTTPATQFDVTAAVASADGHQLLVVGSSREVTAADLARVTHLR